jgi:hypothetical protein
MYAWTQLTPGSEATDQRLADDLLGDARQAGEVRAAPRFYLLPIGEAAVRLGEGCAELLCDARLLPP